MYHLTAYLSELFEQRGVPCHVENDWVLPHDELPAIRAFWYPDKMSGRLDVQIVVRDEVVIEDYFSGTGNGDIALRDAFTDFETNSFHVLLAALWNKHIPQQVEIQPWHAHNKPYTAYLGKYGVHSDRNTTRHVPEDLLPRIQQAIEREPIENDIHWFRLFFFNLLGKHTYEALKDNQNWEAGLRCLQSTTWPEAKELYVLRHFMILRAL